MVAAVDLDDPRFTGYKALIEGSQKLREYSRRMWLRHEEALARAIAEDAGDRVDPTTCRALARFTLEARQLLYGEPDPAQAVDRIFALLDRGWQQFETP